MGIYSYLDVAVVALIIPYAQGDLSSKILNQSISNLFRGIQQSGSVHLETYCNERVDKPS